MGAVCTSLTGMKLPNLYVFCLQAVDYELTRRETWLNGKMAEMEKRKQDAIAKAIDSLKNKQLLVALTAAQAALMEAEKLKVLENTKGELSKAIANLKEEIKQKEGESMDVNKFREQMDKKPLVMLQELVKKWLTNFEDMINNPVTPMDMIKQLEEDAKLNPLELFKKLKSLGGLGDFDEGVIFLSFNPYLTALKTSRKMLGEKQLWMQTQVETMRRDKNECVAKAKAAAAGGDYINALLLIRTVPVYEGKVVGSGALLEALNQEVQSLDAEIRTYETAKPNLAQLEQLLSRNPEDTMAEVIGKWVGKQQEIAGRLMTSAEDTVRMMTAKVSMNPADIAQELNKSGLVPPIDISSLIHSKAAAAAVEQFKTAVPPPVAHMAEHMGAQLPPDIGTNIRKGLGGFFG